MEIFSNTSIYYDTFIIFLKSLEISDLSHPIFVGVEFSPADFAGILYNSEQMTRQNKLEQVTNKINNNKNIKEIWDYSKVNIEILNSKGITNIKYVPLVSPDSYVNKLREFRNIVDYDVGFSGGLSQRRLNILHKLRECGKRVNIVEKFGEERDRELARCKILINIHYADDYMIFESARCEPWIKAGFTVITEKSLDDDPRCINVDYDSLVEKVLDTLDTQELQDIQQLQELQDIQELQELHDIQDT